MDKSGPKKKFIFCTPGTSPGQVTLDVSGCRFSVDIPATFCQHAWVTKTVTKNPNGIEKSVMGAKHPCTVFLRVFMTCWVAVLHITIELVMKR